VSSLAIGAKRQWSFQLRGRALRACTRAACFAACLPGVQKCLFDSDRVSAASATPLDPGSCQGIGFSRAVFVFNIDLRAHGAQLPRPFGFSVVAPYRRGLSFLQLGGTAEGRALTRTFTALSSGNRSDDNKRLLPRRDGIWQRGVGRVVGEVFFAGEEAQEWTTLLRDVVADGAAQHGIVGLERVQHRALRDRTFDFERHLAADLRQRSQMWREYDSDHISVNLSV